MTANALPEQVREFRHAGMDDYIAKPFKQKDLHDAIRRLMGQAKTGNRQSSVGAHAPRPNLGSAACR